MPAHKLSQFTTKEKMENHFLQIVYVANNDVTVARSIAQYIINFGYHCVSYNDEKQLLEALLINPPHVLVIDVDFGGSEFHGAQLMCDLQSEHGQLMPIIFTTSHTSIDVYLQSVRANGVACVSLPDEIQQLVERLNSVTEEMTQEPYRVMIINNEGPKSDKVAMTLEQAGMDVLQVLDPFTILRQLVEFRPDIILMELYLSRCSGIQLARVIRQQSAFLSLPILFLSEEDDIEQQFDALKLGGDAIFTYHSLDKHLLSTVKFRAKRARQLRDLMIRDSLTGLLNHSATMDQLDVELIRSTRTNTHLCFAMIDIDHFKSINDNYGHATGDLILKSLAKLLTQELRRTDIIGRYGGEEFAVVMPNTKLVDAQHRMDGLREQFSAKEYTANESHFNVTFSCGIVEDRNSSPRELKEYSDRLLYEAKANGRNCVIVKE